VELQRYGTCGSLLTGMQFLQRSHTVGIDDYRLSRCREARLRNIIRLSRWNFLASNDGRFSGFHEPGVKLIKRQMEGRGQPVGCEGRIID